MNKKKWLVHAGSILLFLLLTIVYFLPKLEGKELQQGDLEKWRGMVHETIEYKDKTGEVSAWNGSMFSGMPGYTIGIPNNNVNAMFWLEKPIKVLGADDAGIVLLSMLCMYIFLVSIGCPVFVSILGAVAFSFSSYSLIIIEAGHATKAWVMAYMPLVLAGMILTMKKKWLLGTVVFTGALVYNIRHNHIQISYYLGILCFFLYLAYLFYSLKEKKYSDLLKVSGVFVFGVVFAVLSNLSSLYTNYEMGKSSVRGKSELTVAVDGKSDKSSGLDRDYAFTWSYGKSETLTLLIPNFYGGASGGVLSKDSHLAQAFKDNGYQVPEKLQTYTYWGDQPFTSGPVYFGAIICFLFVFSLLVVDNKYKWWIVGVSVVLLMMSWGRNFAAFNDFLFHNLPFYNKFRTPSMALVIPQLTFVLLACMGLSALYKKELDLAKIKRSLFISGGITGGLCLLFALFPSLCLSFSSPSDATYQLPDWYMSALIQDREDLLSADAWRSFFFILVTFLLLLFSTMSKQEKYVKYAMVIISILSLCDLWSVDKRYLNDSDFVRVNHKKQEYVATVADKFILEDKDPSYRVLSINNPFNDTNIPYFHKSIGGYNAAKLRRYQDLIDLHIDPELKSVMAKVGSARTMEEATELFNGVPTPVLDMLNMRYFIISNDIPPILNRNANGNAWFVKNVKYVESPDAEMLALSSINPKESAVVDVRFSSLVKEGDVHVDSTSAIVMEEYKPDRVSYKSKSKTDAVAVFSEIYYQPGWKSFIDGKQVDHFRTNWILRGLKIPAGQHDIEFRFEPDTYWKLLTLSNVLSFLFFISFLAIWLYMKVRKTKYNKI